MFSKKFELIFIVIFMISICNGNQTEDDIDVDVVDIDINNNNNNNEKKQEEINNEDEDDTTTYEDYADDYYDGDDDDDNNNNNNDTAINYNDDKSSDLKQINQTTTSTTTTTTMSIIRSNIDVNDADDLLPKINYKCPANCQCTDDTLFVNCSNLNLINIPINLPTNAINIDLSHNNIEKIGPSDFYNCTALRNLYLNNNRIINIENNIFDNNKNLQKLNLASNLLSTMDKNVFINIDNLVEINLNFNPIILPIAESFLNLPDLQILSLEGCNLTQIYDLTFENLTDLTSLNLANNLFNERINVDAFESLIQLYDLKIPNIGKDDLYRLCTTLTTIDVISLDNYNVSCFELTSGSTFEESTITNAPITSKPVLKIDTNNSDNNNGSISMSTQKPSQNINKTIDAIDVNQRKTDKSIQSENNNNLSTKNITTTTETSTISIVKGNETITNDGGTKTSTTTPNKNDVIKQNDNTVSISSQSINNILIGIIIVAVIGLAIGLVCRKDVCGIKTKLCRTRRPPSADQIRPAEEVPLNKVA